MIKKIAVCFGIFFVFSFSAIASNQTNGLSSFASKSATTKQKSLNTIKDYRELVSELRKASAIGDIQSKTWLGGLYYLGTKLKDGTVIAPQRKRGTRLLYSSISGGSVQALSFLTMQYIHQKDVRSLTKIVKLAQESNEISLKDKDYFTSILASLILDTKSGDGMSLEVALKWLYRAEKKRPTPKMQFILANMYNMMGNKNAATMYLNKSCLHPSMEKICRRYKQNPFQKKERTCQKL